MIVKIKGFGTKLSKLLLKIKKFYATQESKLTYLGQFVFVVVIYGLLINFVLSAFSIMVFSFKNLIASGVLFYFLKEEIPRIIVKSKVHSGK